MKTLAFLLLATLLDADAILTPPPGFRWWESIIYGAIMLLLKSLVDHIIDKRKKTPVEKIAEAKELLKEIKEFKELLGDEN